jgi:hypothetical protein
MIRIGILEVSKEGKLMLFDLTEVYALGRAIKGGDKNKILTGSFVS